MPSFSKQLPKHRHFRQYPSEGRLKQLVQVAGESRGAAEKWEKAEATEELQRLAVLRVMAALWRPCSERRARVVTQMPLKGWSVKDFRWICPQSWGRTCSARVHCRNKFLSSFSASLEAAVKCGHTIREQAAQRLRRKPPGAGSSCSLLMHVVMELYIMCWSPASSFTFSLGMFPSTQEGQLMFWISTCLQVWRTTLLNYPLFSGKKGELELEEQGKKQNNSSPFLGGGCKNQARNPGRNPLLCISVLQWGPLSKDCSK